MQKLSQSALLLLSASAMIVSADTLSFNPSLYQPIPYKYRSLDLVPSLGLFGNFDRSDDNEEKTKYKNAYNATNEENDFNFSSSLDLNFNDRKDNLTRQLFTYANLNSRLNLSKSDRENDTTYQTSSDELRSTYSTSSISPYISATFRQDRLTYLKKDKFYLRAQYGISGNYSNSSHESYDTTDSEKYDTFAKHELNEARHTIEDTEYNGRRMNISPELLLATGYGRITDVTYSAVSAHTFQYLNKETGVKGNTEDILELAALYEKLKRERVFDSRESQIEQITAITDWFKKKGLAAKMDVRTVMNIQDFWLYGFNQSRSKGSQFMIGAESEIEKSQDKNVTSRNNKSLINDVVDSSYTYSRLDSTKKVISKYQIRGVFGYNYERPLGMKGQLSLKAEVKGGPDIIDTAYTYYTKRNVIYKPEKNILDDNSGMNSVVNMVGTADLFLSYSLYPTYRSTVTFKSDAQYDKIYRDDDDSPYLNNDNLRLSAGGSWKYYFSPRFSFTSVASYGYSFTKDHNLDHKKSEHDIGLAAGFTYSFF